MSRENKTSNHKSQKCLFPPSFMISRYSVNEGRCWFKYKFTDHEFHVTGLVTEPGARTMKFSLWGNTLPSHEWQVITVDFEQVLKRACKLISFNKAMSRMYNGILISCFSQEIWGV